MGSLVVGRAVAIFSLLTFLGNTPAARPFVLPGGGTCRDLSLAGVDSFHKPAECLLHDAVLGGVLGKITLVAAGGCRFVNLVTIHVIYFPVVSLTLIGLSIFKT